jgi:hypothetical protein
MFPMGLGIKIILLISLVSLPCFRLFEHVNTSMDIMEEGCQLDSKEF